MQFGGYFLIQGAVPEGKGVSAVNKEVRCKIEELLKKVSHGKEKHRRRYLPI